MTDDIRAVSIRVSGLVQGVGFRPFLHRLATDHGIHGWAINASDSVRIHAEGKAPSIENFIDDIEIKAPPLANVENVVVSETTLEGFTGFEIRQSKSGGSEVTRVSPDTAICDECLDDMATQPNRIDYPFINCTNCGPRFSIVRELPYDRPLTTMAPFEMCESCQKEYNDIGDRRYHAQPNACAVCGPEYALITGDGRWTDVETALSKTALALEAGGIIAIKGMGGFHLSCDAYNQSTVLALRERKRRDGKPLAVMCRDLDTVRELADLSLGEEELLTSRVRPIVLARLLEERLPIADSVSNGLNTVGVMLPYMPIHYLLFNRLSTNVIVLTSGNITDEPIAISNTEAMDRLSTITDTFLVTNREIHNRNDDSVVFLESEAPTIIRRSRGLAPDPVDIGIPAEGIAACGAELKGSFCLGKGTTGIMSQHIGDLKNPETYDFYTESFSRFSSLFRFSAELAACDLHPDYLSTRFAATLGVDIVEVQHHYAHIASCLAEHHIEEKVIGVAMDGTGYGDDGNIWGGEFFLCDLTGYHRVSHLEYLPLPGGDAAIREPWRMAAGVLRKLDGRDFANRSHPVLEQCTEQEMELLAAAIDRGINTPMTSSTGRVFDAAAALLGLVSHARFEAEAPMRLEAAIVPDAQAYPFAVDSAISLVPTFEALLTEQKSVVPTGVISARFHNTLVKVVVEMAQIIRDDSGVETVALSGGVFQNRYFLGGCKSQLSDRGFKVIAQNTVPCNDGGISLGQLAVAAAGRRDRG